MVKKRVVGMNARECESCGMRMDAREKFGGGLWGNRYCVYCCDERGQLKPKEKILRQLTHYFMQSKKLGQEEAEKEAQAHLSKMPKWKNA
jgi:hypothetical protein